MLMSQLLPFIVVGVTAGTVYAMAAVGLVVTYKTSGVFNFAQGAFGTAAAYLFFALHVQHGVPWPVAALISVGVLSVGLGFGMEALARRLATASLTMQVVATVGLLVGIEAVCNQVYGTTAQQFPQFLPTSTFAIAGTRIQWNQLIIVVVSVAITGALYIFFRAARLGKAMRAVVDDPQLLDMSGTNPVTVRRYAWIIGSFLATLAGLLLAPSISLDSSALTLLVVTSFGAAAIGRFSSLPLTWVGGLVIGVGSSLATKFFSGTSILGGLPLGLPFLILFVVLLVYPKRWMATPRMPAVRERTAWRAAPGVRLAGALIVTLFLVAVPSFVGFQLTTWTVTLTDVLLFLSLGLLVRTSGQLSLCQIGFAAVGAVAFSKLATSAHAPWVLALLLAGLVVVPIGALVAIPAIRLSGLYLAIATFGFGILLQQMFYGSSLMFGLGGYSGLPMPRPSWLGLGSDRGFFYLTLVLTVLTAGLTYLITETRLGRLLRGMDESPRALVTSGANLNITRVIVFAVSAFLAGIAGALQGMALTEVTPANFDPFLSLTFVAIVAIAVGGEPWYALVAGGAFGLIPGYFPAQWVTNVMQLVFGVGAVLVGLGISLPTPARLVTLLSRGRTATRTAPPVRLPVPAPAAPEPAAHPTTAGGLAVDDLMIRFGGLVAADRVSLAATPGTITGLIGPNGAGKTSTFNACSGLVRPTSGRVLFGGRDVSGFTPARRARVGLGRTFQRVELCESFPVYDNIAIGCEAGLAGGNPLKHVLSRPAARREIDYRVWEAVKLCGLEAVVNTPAHALSTGQRRLLELARCLVSPFQILLLDEPSSGLDRAETDRFGNLLERVVAERGLGILLVEHDMDLVMRVCSTLYVLDYGELIFSGSPGEARNSPIVQAAYLGQPEPVQGKTA
jgi:ABC-type branched-subunit amino acid transport system ATPase component/branched-subunit amino acid ABC-type transport system permease component